MARFLRVSSASFTLLLAVVFFPVEGWSHLGNISYSDIVVEGDTVYYRLKFAAHLAPVLEARLPEKPTRQELLASEGHILEWLRRGLAVESRSGPCEPSIENVVGPDSNVDLELIVSYRCDKKVEGLRVEFTLFDDALPSYENVLSLRMPDGARSYVFTQTHNLMIVGMETAEVSQDLFRGFFELGVAHIWSGYDHLLFLLALLLLGGSIGRLAGIVTSFTLAHSITLSLATLDFVSLDPAAVEVAIALSIVYVAAENIVRGASDHRWVATFLFGLVHGFGFAGILKETGLPPNNFFVPLFSFNLGVEAGQLVVVSLVVPLLRLSMSGKRERPVRLIVSWLIVAVGLLWTVQRLPASIA